MTGSEVVLPERFAPDDQGLVGWLSQVDGSHPPLSSAAARRVRGRGTALELERIGGHEVRERGPVVSILIRAELCLGLFADADVRRDPLADRWPSVVGDRARIDAGRRLEDA